MSCPNKYVGDINTLQISIMQFVKRWVDKKKTPVPKIEIVSYMEVSAGVSTNTSLNALRSLMRKGYIRKAYSEKANRTLYAQCRTF